MLNKYAKTLLAAAVAGLMGAAPARAADTSIGVTQIVEHPALDAARKGILDELADQGYVKGKNLKVDFQSAQGNPTIAAQIAKKFAGAGHDLVIAIATPSAQTMVSAAGGRLPIIFSAVTDPVGAKLVSNLEKPGKNVTGVSDLSPIKEHLKLITRITPAAKRIGIIYNPGEANSVSLAKLVHEHSADFSMTIVEASAPNSNAVLQAARSLVGKVDAIYVPTDNTAISALEGIIKVGQDASIPVYAGDTDSVPRGAIAALGFNYYDVGRQTGAMAARVLKGEKPGDIAVEQVQKLELHVNPGSAKKMGVTIPDDVIASAKTVVE